MGYVFWSGPVRSISTLDSEPESDSEFEFEFESVCMVGLAADSVACRTGSA